MSKEDAAIPLTKQFDQFKVMLEEAEQEYEEIVGINDYIIVQDVEFHFDSEGRLDSVIRSE